ncbi:uncharacterized protein BP5553_09489 [Venustampulla echinocandica]|uniref:Apple domain-containing protein n=1 Tax=Venustampulla echinocandica TaxID=2656787 RepID=A0A370TCW3_9HELO|nr:uncharacterized protein BP5553_09489 [Venustampulla echinocandica]RDL32087.1 hypothetical protein BP5553_09489 [Venustampulla echinocandica]
MMFQTILVLALLAILPYATPSPLSDRPRSVGTMTRSIITSTITYPDLLAARHITTESLPVGTTTTTATTTSAASSTTETGPAPIPTKTNVKGCHVEGVPNAYMLSNTWGSSRASDVLLCQLKCMYISQCQSYSFRAPSTTREDNCVFYHMFITRGPQGVIPSRTSGIFFSDKYPGDGSNFCYGSREL